MRNANLFAATRVRDIASDRVLPASEWQRTFVERDRISPFEAWAKIAAAIVDRSMRIEGSDEVFPGNDG